MSQRQNQVVWRRPFSTGSNGFPSAATQSTHRNWPRIPTPATSNPQGGRVCVQYLCLASQLSSVSALHNKGHRSCWVFEVLWRSTLTFCWESYKYLYISYVYYVYIPFPVVVDPRLGQMRSWQHLSRGPHCASWSHGLHVVNWNLPGGNLPGVWNHGEWSEQFFNRVSCMMLYGFAMFCARLCTFVYYQIINDFSKGVVLCHGTATWLWPSPSGTGSHHGSRGGNVQLPSLDGWGGAKPSEVHNLKISNGKWSKWSTPELSVGISNTGQLSRAAKPGVFVPSSSCKNATRAPAVLVWWTQLRSQTPGGYQTTLSSCAWLIPELVLLSFLEAIYILWASLGKGTSCLFRHPGERVEEVQHIADRWSLWVAVMDVGLEPTIATLPGKPRATRKGNGMGSLWEFWRNE